MTGGHGFNRQHGCLFAGIRDRYVRMSNVCYGLAIETPPYLDRQVTLQDTTHCGDLLAPVSRFLADGKWGDLRCDWK